MLMGGMSGSRSSSKLEDNDMKGDDGKVQPGKPFESVSTTVQQLKKQILTNRFLYVKEKLDGNRRITGQFSNELLVLSKSRFDVTTGRTEVKNPLTVRMESSLCKLGGLCLLGGENDEINCHEEGSNTSSTIIFGSSLGGRSVIRPIKIPHVQKIPPYTTWIFLDRNQIMADDQSVVGRRRIYYDQNGSEALICSDSEEDPLDEEDEKYDFSEGDDDMLRNVISQHGLTDTVLNSLSQCLEVKATEIQTRYEFLQQQQQQKGLEHTPDEASVDYSISDIFTGKDLDTAMDSFDNLFCRRCLVFDCRLHGCSQPFVFPCEKQLPWSPPEEESRLPCGSNCYRLVESLNADETNCKNSFGGLSEETPTSCGNIEGSKVLSHRKGLSHNDLKSEKNVQLESACSNEKQATEACHANVVVKWEGNDRQSKSCSNGKQGKKVKENSNKTNKRNAEQVLASMRKRQKKIASDVGSSVSGGITPVDGRRNSRKSTSKMTIKKKNRDSVSSKKSLEEENSESNEHKWRDSNEVEYDKQMENDCDMLQSEEVSSCKMELATEDPKVEQNAWSSIEKSLYTKGVQIFGKNSCLIARNLLYGLKTCSEVAEYMDHNGFGNQGTVEIGTSSRTESSTKGTEVRARTRFWRRRGRVRRLKYTWKSTGHPAIRKRIADSKDLTCRQYTPCDCQSTCGKQCPCLRSGTCCEKYCGCPKVCKNRFRGCHCAKSQCRSRQCPCFAAGRECDPDVCRNCWVGCGDGTLGGPPQRGDNYECRNMKLLLKQQQRVLLGRSDVSGWGAFLKNSVNKHDYLGEYTGELISHREADKRGKIYDRENSSFLFNLNDQYVLDAYRKGDKLKFANHSPTPNCYAKVIMVAGDHRVGIFAKERICGGEELFYDYRYEPDKAPAWARKAEDSNIKRDDTSVSHGRAQKVAR